MRAAVPLIVVAALATAHGAHGSSACDAQPYDCAVRHIERQEFTAAAAVLDPLLQREPRNVRVLNLLGIALTGAGRRDAANARFREALRLEPSFYPALKNLAVNELEAGDTRQAQKHLESVLKLAPADELTHLYLGEIQFAQGRLAVALRHYGRSGERVFGNPAWTMHYADCLLREGRRSEAVAALDRLPADHADARFEAGLTLGRAGAHAEAARFFASARPGYRDPYAAAYNQMLMAIEAGQHGDAIAVGEALLAADPKRAEVRSLVSRAYFASGRVKDAYDALRDAARLEPDDEAHYLDLATICLDLENYDLGIEIVDVGLHYRPRAPLLYLQRGVLLAMKAQLADAEQAFTTARDLSSGMPAAVAALAMVYMQTGRTDRAVEMLRAEGRWRTDHILAYVFAVSLVRSGVDPAAPAADEAIAALRAAIAAAPDFAPARSQLGRLLLKRHDLPGAIAELEQAVALDSGATAALYNLAQAYNRQGDRQKASALLAQVSRMNAEERGDNPDGELKRTVVRIVKEGAALKSGSPP